MNILKKQKSKLHEWKKCFQGGEQGGSIVTKGHENLKELSSWGSQQIKQLPYLQVLKLKKSIKALKDFKAIKKNTFETLSTLFSQNLQKSLVVIVCKENCECCFLEGKYDDIDCI